MSEDYYVRLKADYALSLFQAEVDKNTDCTPLSKWADVIMDWYEEQLEYDELDWGIDIPELVKDDIVFHEMVVITEDNPDFDEIDKLYEEEGCCSVEEYTDKIARILHQGRDNDGRTVYLCQKVL